MVPGGILAISDVSAGGESKITANRVFGIICASVKKYKK